MTHKKNVEPNSLKLQLKRGMTIALILVFAVFVPAFMIFLLFDQHDPKWVTCEVISAEPSKGHRFNASEWLVGIDTEDCGRVVYSVGVTEGNAGELASSFEPGEYDFELGLSSRAAAHGWLPFVAATAHGYRPSP